MAYRELHVVEIKEILRLWANGHGLRTVASRTGIDRKTVRRYVEAAQAAGLERGDVDRAVEDALIADVVTSVQPGAPAEVVGVMREHCRKHAEALSGWAAEGCKGPKLVKLLMRHTGVPVPLRTLQRFIEEEVVAPDKGTVRVVDPDPGQVLEVDFLDLGEFKQIGSGEIRKMYALLCTASYSRHQFVWPCLTQTQDDVIDGLEGAWDFFGGVFPVLLPDNLKAVVSKADRIEPVFAESFLEYAQSRKFEIDPARVRTPTDKARVERQVQYVRNDFFKGERFGSVEEARIAARQWSRVDAGMRTHARTRRKPLEAFEADEKPLLNAAPTEPYDRPKWGTHHVGRDHAVVVDYALYSVPYALGECELRVRSDRATVKLYVGAQLVKLHPRQPEGGTRLDPVDLPPGKAALATRDATTLCEQAAGFGPHVAEYARRLAEGPLPWSRIRFVYRLLGLARRYGAATTDEACARALELDVIDVLRIGRMLERGLVTRGLITSTPSPNAPKQGHVLRFARSRQEFRTGGGGDAPA